jgi:Ca2+-binding EF-hand superfamily protein
MRKNIMKGRFSMSSQRWCSVSSEAKAFIRALMEPDQSVRLSARSALQHAWITKHYQARVAVFDRGLVDALRDYTKASTLRRCLLNAMAWHLPNDETTRARDQFIALDVDFGGTLAFSELRGFMVDQFSVSPEEAAEIFSVIDSNHDAEIHYSEFLAAVMCTQVNISDDLLQATFRNFDIDLSGSITVDNLLTALGASFEGNSTENLIEQSVALDEFGGARDHVTRRGGISYEAFVALVRGDMKAPPAHGLTACSRDPTTSLSTASSMSTTPASTASTSAVSPYSPRPRHAVGLLGNLHAGMPRGGKQHQLVKSNHVEASGQPRMETNTVDPGCYCTLQ